MGTVRDQRPNEPPKDDVLRVLVHCVRSILGVLYSVPPTSKELSQERRYFHL